jgi:UDP-N-acetylmuramate--alanine ligase
MAMFERYRVIHFIGIGGIGMSGIAEVLHNLDYEVTGSDARDSETVERLRGLGIEVHIGHSPGNVNGAHVVVASSAIKPDNAEVAEAVRLSIPVIPRAEMLAELGRLKYSVLVAGTHGKTTTTSFVSTVLAHAGFDPTVVIGGKLKALGTNARLGRGDFMAAEADESDGSFLKLNPTIGVVTNIDREHMDYFKTMEALKGAFLSFMNKVPFYGLTIACIDDEGVRELLPLVHRRVRTYGFSADAELRATDLRKGFMSTDFEAIIKGRNLGRFRIPAPGEHMVLNCLASVAVGLELQIGVEKIRDALDRFEGIQRRLEFKGEAVGVRVYDDYGHHPTEIKATLKAMKDSMDTGRLVVVFQPHRFSRTRDLMEEFRTSFADADSLVLMDIYPAGESPVEGVSTEEMMKGMGGGDIVHIGGVKEAAGYVADHIGSGDVVLTLGAGDVWKVADELIGILGNGG